MADPANAPSDPELLRTPLHALHAELGGRLVPFAGWDMPVQYEGVIAEHTWCRSSAALFDVSHMAVVEIWPGTNPSPAEALERLTPAGVTSLAEGRQRYGLFTNGDGGVIDDFMVANHGTHIGLVVNASRADVDIPHMIAGLPDCEVRVRDDLSLLAIQGPRAGEVIGRFDPSLADTYFLDVASGTIEGIEVTASRSGYTGEDGFEIAVANEHAETLARLLLAQPEVEPAGLGARDTLRLEAGLHLYGNDLDETTSPIEAGLRWTIPKRRREAADFPGAERILAEHADGTSRVRVGLSVDGKRPVRDGSPLLDLEGEPIGVVTSGGYGPSVEAPIAMGFVPPEAAEPGTQLLADVRGKHQPVTVTDLPFSPHRYHRAPKAAS